MGGNGKLSPVPSDDQPDSGKILLDNSAQNVKPEKSKYDTFASKVSIMKG